MPAPMAWLGVMQRVNFMLKLDFDLEDLEKKSARLVELMNAEIDDLYEEFFLEVELVQTEQDLLSALEFAERMVAQTRNIDIRATSKRPTRADAARSRSRTTASPC